MPTSPNFTSGHIEIAPLEDAMTFAMTGGTNALDNERFHAAPHAAERAP